MTEQLITGAVIGIGSLLAGFGLGRYIKGKPPADRDAWDEAIKKAKEKRDAENKS